MHAHFKTQAKRDEKLESQMNELYPLVDKAYIASRKHLDIKMSYRFNNDLSTDQKYRA